jgi:hypothetical protein
VPQLRFRSHIDAVLSFRTTQRRPSRKSSFQNVRSHANFSVHRVWEVTWRTFRTRPTVCLFWFYRSECLILFWQQDPLFFLLHAQLDRVWAAWQAHDPRNFNAIAGGVDQDLQDFDAHPLGTGTPVTKDTILYMAGLGPNAKVDDVFDTAGGYLCYQYAT